MGPAFVTARRDPYIDDIRAPMERVLRATNKWTVAIRRSPWWNLGRQEPENHASTIETPSSSEDQARKSPFVVVLTYSSRSWSACLSARRPHDARWRRWCVESLKSSLKLPRRTLQIAAQAYHGVQRRLRLFAVSRREP